MTFKIVIQPVATAQVRAAFLYIQERAPDAADRWLSGIEAAMQSLSKHATWHAEAPESREFDHPVRQMLYGRRLHRYRILYSVSGSTVYILQVRHGAMRPLQKGDL